MPVGSADQLYYSFDYRNVHFVALSTDSLSRSEGPGDPEQMAWLVSDLQVRVVHRVCPVGVVHTKSAPS